MCNKVKWHEKRKIWLGQENEKDKNERKQDPLRQDQNFSMRLASGEYDVKISTELQIYSQSKANYPFGERQNCPSQEHCLLYNAAKDNAQTNIQITYCPSSPCIAPAPQFPFPPLQQLYWYARTFDRKFYCG